MDAPASSRQLTWLVQNCAQFESHWIAMHRFLWMNGLTGESLWRIVSSGAAPGIGSTLPEEFDRKLRESPHTRDFFAHLHSRSLRQCFGAENGEEIERTQRVRFCPLCLRECFHSPLFQLANLEVCPFHGVPLQYECEYCNTPEVGSLILDPRDLKHPLQCSRCRRPFFGDDVNKVFAGFARGTSTFRKAERAVNQVASTQLIRICGISEEQDWLKNDYGAICDCFVVVAGRPAGHEPWRAPDFDKFTVERSVEPERLPHFVRDRLPEPLNEDFENATLIAKSINRMLTRAVRRVCGHSRTMQLPWDRVWRPSAMEPVLLMSPYDCPCCAVIDRWRAYAGKVIAMRNIARTRKAISPIYESSAIGGYRLDYSLEPNALATALLSSFTCFAVYMGALLEFLAGEGAHGGDHSGRPLSHPRFLELELQRNGIEEHGYLFETPNDYVFVAYSMRLALDALEQCVLRYKKGPLWCPSKPVFAAKRFPRDDVWYLRMSEWLNRSNKLWVTNPSMQAGGRFFAR